MKKILGFLMLSAIGGALTLAGYKLFFEQPQVVIEQVTATPNLVTTNYSGNSATIAMENTNFTVAAEKSLNAVVHVKNTSYKTVRDPFAEFFYGEGSGSKKYSQIGTGSGVIISSDGYIVTNNHVINRAEQIEITLNNKKVYTAELIGADPTNDIALVKIDADELPYITFGDSDNVKIGEWVLAVGNPYNLTSTVTAGIISAKGRDLQGNNGVVDSFIQTDAAVNPGNSGGALVNTNGDLVGINTAISSQTGAFVGYSFAVPSNIAKKVIEDLMEFGNVQSAVLGIRGGELNNDVAEQLEVDFTEGFYISEVVSGSGAEKGGLQRDDIIIKLDNVAISTYADLTGFIRTKRPNDTVYVTYLRDGEERTTNVTLTKIETTRVNSLGLELRNLDSGELKRLKLENGVEITDISNRELEYYGVEKGFVITEINNKKMRTVEDVTNMINSKGTGEVLRMEIMNKNGEIERYIFR